MIARLLGGVLGGIAGGIVFGVMMQMMDMLGMVASLANLEGTVAGWGVHLVISAAIGVGYALTAGGLRPGYGAGIGTGLAYGAVWWVLGALVLMPLMMGMGAFPPIGETQVMSLIGHLVYGLVLGAAFVAVRDRAAASSGTADASMGEYSRS